MTKRPKITALSTTENSFVDTFTPEDLRFFLLLDGEYKGLSISSFTKSGRCEDLEASASECNYLIIGSDCFGTQDHVIAINAVENANKSRAVNDRRAEIYEFTTDPPDIRILRLAQIPEDIFPGHRNSKTAEH